MDLLYIVGGLPLVQPPESSIPPRPPGPSVKESMLLPPFLLKLFVFYVFYQLVLSPYILQTSEAGLLEMENSSGRENVIKTKNGDMKYDHVDSVKIESWNYKHASLGIKLEELDFNHDMLQVQRALAFEHLRRSKNSNEFLRAMIWYESKARSQDLKSRINAKRMEFVTVVETLDTKEVAFLEQMKHTENRVQVLGTAFTAEVKARTNDLMGQMNSTQKELKAVVREKDDIQEEMRVMREQLDEYRARDAFDNEWLENESILTTPDGDRPKTKRRSAR